MQNTDMVIKLSVRPKKRWSTVVLVTLKQNITRQNVSDIENALKRIRNQNIIFPPFQSSRIYFQQPTSLCICTILANLDVLTQFFTHIVTQLHGLIISSYFLDSEQVV